MSRVLALALLVIAAASPAAAANSWPSGHAYYTLRPVKTAGKEMTDVVWAHLHEGDSEALSVSFTVEFYYYGPALTGPAASPPASAITTSGLEMRYTVHGLPVSGWLSWPAAFTLNWNDAALDGLGANGIHDVSLEVRCNADLPITNGVGTAVKYDFRPDPLYLHIHRTAWSASTSVPVLVQNSQDTAGQTPVATYITVGERNMNRNYNLDPSVTGIAGTGWSTGDPSSNDLYQEDLQPHMDLFQAVQMWWQEPVGTVDAGLKFVRGVAPKFQEYLTDLYYGDNLAFSAFGYNGHRTFPVKDGPRGIGWSNGYVQGIGDVDGKLWFVNTSGQFRVMEPNGELHTLAGWRVDPAKDPVWMLKPLNSIRESMELRGTWTDGQDAADPGLHQPMDVAQDPADLNTFYIAGGYDNIIWKAVVNRTTWTATMSILAGSTIRASGYTNGTGTAARFHFPISLTFDAAVCDCLLVADLTNDAIRKVTRAGVVTTLYGNTDVPAQVFAVDASHTEFSDAFPGSRRHLTGFADYNRAFLTSAGTWTVNSTQAGMGVRPAIYLPWTIRTFNNGDIALLERGTNSIRRINPTTHVTTEVMHFNNGGFGNSAFGWIWIDINRYNANTGPLDSIYLAMATSYDVPNSATGGLQHFNEEFWYITPDGVTEKYVIGAADSNQSPDGVGEILFTDQPHYPWLVAVDPRGALLTAGIGEHGITRIRQRKSTDPRLSAAAGSSATGTGTQRENSIEGRYIWQFGGTFPGTWGTFTPSTDLGSVGTFTKFGWQGHNMIGLPSTWDLTGTETDDQIATLFEFPAQITGTANAKKTLADYLKFYRGPALENGVVPTPKRRFRFKVEQDAPVLPLVPAPWLDAPAQIAARR